MIFSDVRVKYLPNRLFTDNTQHYQSSQDSVSSIRGKRNNFS